MQQAYHAPQKHERQTHSWNQGPRDIRTKYDEQVVGGAGVNLPSQMSHQCIENDGDEHEHDRVERNTVERENAIAHENVCQRRHVSASTAKPASSRRPLWP